MEQLKIGTEDVNRKQQTTSGSNLYLQKVEANRLQRCRIWPLLNGLGVIILVQQCLAAGAGEVTRLATARKTCPPLENL